MKDKLPKKIASFRRILRLNNRSTSLIIIIELTRAVSALNEQQKNEGEANRLKLLHRLRVYFCGSFHSALSPPFIVK